MDLRELYKHTLENSEKFAELMSVCSTLLKYSDLAKATRDELLSRVPSLKVENFQFGYFPTNDQLSELFKYISPEDLEKIGAIYKTISFDSGHPEQVYYGKLRSHNMILPYKDVYGNIIGLVGRTLLSKEEMKDKGISKYKNTSLLKALNLFGLYEAKKEILKKDNIIIVEGQFDCITCHRFGYKNVVALGGSSFTKYHFYLIKRYTNNIYLMLDNDDSGIKAQNKILSRWGKLANIKTIKIPQCYKDVDEGLKKDPNLMEKVWPRIEQISPII